MLEQLFLTAIITCSTGHAVCNSYELEEFTRVEVCGVVPEDRGIKSVTMNQEYSGVFLMERCTSYRFVRSVRSTKCVWWSVWLWFHCRNRGRTRVGTKVIVAGRGGHVPWGTDSKLYSSILPLLEQLKKNPEKEYIYWPNRVEKIEQFEQHLLNIYNGE